MPIGTIIQDDTVLGSISGFSGTMRQGLLVIFQKVLIETIIPIRTFIEHKIVPGTNLGCTKATL